MRAQYPEWTGDEPCRQVDPEWFFPEPKDARSAEQRMVYEMCATCESQPACLEWGLHHEATGSWGGINESGLRQLRAQLGIKLNGIASPISLGLMRWEAS